MQHPLEVLMCKGRLLSPGMRLCKPVPLSKREAMPTAQPHVVPACPACLARYLPACQKACPRGCFWTLTVPQSQAPPGTLRECSASHLASSICTNFLLAELLAKQGGWLLGCLTTGLSSLRVTRRNRPTIVTPAYDRVSAHTPTPPCGNQSVATSSTCLASCLHGLTGLM